MKKKTGKKKQTKADKDFIAKIATLGIIGSSGGSEECSDSPGICEDCGKPIHTEYLGTVALPMLPSLVNNLLKSMSKAGRRKHRQAEANSDEMSFSA